MRHYACKCGLWSTAIAVGSHWDSPNSKAEVPWKKEKKLEFALCWYLYVAKEVDQGPHHFETDSSQTHQSSSRPSHE